MRRKNKTYDTSQPSKRFQTNLVSNKSGLKFIRNFLTSKCILNQFQVALKVLCERVQCAVV